MGDQGVFVTEEIDEAWNTMDYVETHGGKWWLYDKDENGKWRELH